MTRKTRRKDRRAQAKVPNIAGLTADDPETRAQAVRSLCPCRVGWEAYGEHVLDVDRLAKDEDPKVRKHALHVREDAGILELRADRAERAEAAAERLAAQRARDRHWSQRRRRG